MSALERNTQVLAPTPPKVLGPGIYRWGGAYLRRLAQVLGQDDEVDERLRVAAVLATKGTGRVSFSRPLDWPTHPQLRQG